MLRLFVAVELSDEVKRSLGRVQRSLAQFDQAVRWVKPEQIHLTLKFLGDTADNRVPELHTAIEQAVTDIEPFDFTTAGTGCFPPRGQVRVVWIGLEEASGVLLTCQQRIDEALADVGVEPEDRPFTPHLTLGRVKFDKTSGRLREAVTVMKVPSVGQSVESVTLMMSELTPKGAIHTPLATHPLGAK